MSGSLLEGAFVCSTHSHVKRFVVFTDRHSPMNLVQSRVKRQNLLPTANRVLPASASAFLTLSAYTLAEPPATRHIWPFTPPQCESAFWLGLSIYGSVYLHCSKLHKRLLSISLCRLSSSKRLIPTRYSRRKRESSLCRHCSHFDKGPFLTLVNWRNRTRTMVVLIQCFCYQRFRQ